MRKWMFAVPVAAAVLVNPAAAHRGPEQHPTLQDLDETASELHAEISDMERRLRERVDGLETAAAAPDGEAMMNAVDRAVVEAAAELTRSVDELAQRVDAIAAIGAALLALLGGATALLGIRLRAVRRSLSSQSARRVQGGNADRADGKTKPEPEEQHGERRVVTHTLKDRIGTILELHHPGEAWSPRTVADAIEDIEEHDTEYVARGPRGNEAEIEVRQGSNKPYLRTKPDDHGGNNLGELPDP